MFVLAFYGEYFLPEYRDGFDTKYSLWAPGADGLKKLDWKYNVGLLSQEN